MTLSPKVSQNPPKEGGRPKNRNGGPFGGMNMTKANIRGIPERRSASQEKRSGHSKFAPKPDALPVDRMKHLKMQRSLASVSYSQRNAIKEHLAEVESFEDFPLLPSVLEAIGSQALKGVEEAIPTPVQRLAIPALLGSDRRGKRRDVSNETMEQFLLAAETGSGKTLSYLLPTIDAIKRAEAVDEEFEEHRKLLEVEKHKRGVFELEPPPLSNNPHPTTGRPRAIILLPTAELVAQVGHLSKSLSHQIKFRSAFVSSAFSGKVIRNRLFTPAGIDVLISTPHLLASIAESDPNVLGRVTHLIVDEADSLFDRGFAPLTSAILDRATPTLKQLILCSATIPRSLDQFLRKRFPDVRRIVTPNLHAIPRRVQLSVVDVEKEPYRGNKDLACAETIWQIGKDAAAGEAEGDETIPIGIKRIVVFVNEREKTLELAEYLKSKGIDAMALMRDTPENRQSDILAGFTEANYTPPTVTSAAPKKEPDAATAAKYTPPLSTTMERRVLHNVKVLIMTDIGSRGIDTLAVRHVVLYDVPHTTIDFIHRLGRTGRMGRRGRGIVLVGRHDRKDVVKEVREGMYRGQALI
jgi:ATP-dependent RNA helicase MRH4, mitochondrial